ADRSHRGGSVSRMTDGTYSGLDDAEIISQLLAAGGVDESGDPYPAGDPCMPSWHATPPPLSTVPNGASRLPTSRAS
ncbi:MAG TPA: hypothetical protein VF734_14105, partial [Pseudonocardiaceae bacterium]